MLEETKSAEAISPPGASPAGLPPADELAALRAIVQGTARSTGDEFFRTLVRHLAAAVDTGYAFVAEFVGPLRARALAYWKPTGFATGVEWDLPGTPCEDVVRGNLCHHPVGVSRDFPADEDMVEWGIESYLGVPLIAADGQHLGHLAVFDSRPMPAEPRKLFTFRIFAARAAAELERLRGEKLLRESEERYRDLFDEAPCAYVYADADGTLRRVNRRTAQLLGYSAEELIGTSVFRYLAPDPAAPSGAAEGRAPFFPGAGRQGTEFEMRRKDGSPLWVAVWDRPRRGPDGAVTGGRSMWVDVTDRVLVERDRARLEEQNHYLREEIQSVHNFEEIVGSSPALSAVLDAVRRVAPTDASVLITGETGTGKELIARAVHSLSGRRDRPLIKVNCAALPTGLVESELFGHEKGAFTGALSRRVGRFELAHGGTLFLDEVGAMPLDVQAKLLRVLQEHEFERVGASRPIRVDVRVIAATNRDLLAAVREGRFREDLYYRLNVFPVTLPPLRQRREDVPLLVKFLVARFGARIGRRITGVDDETMRRLTGYAWPGNVREMENLLERAVILATGETLRIDPESFGPAPAAAPSPASTTDLEEVERNHILSVLNQARWVIEGPRGAAKLLNLHPNTLRSRLKKMGLTRPAPPSPERC